MPFQARSSLEDEGDLSLLLCSYRHLMAAVALQCRYELWIQQSA